MSEGLKVSRRFTRHGEDPFETVTWRRRDTKIMNPDGSVVFEMRDAEIPVGWSQVAADIMVSKYFRKAGVPLYDAEGTLLDEDHQPRLGSESSARQVFNRLAGTWRWWGEQGGYFASEEDAQAFEDELKYMLCHQMAAPNSPQWFNTGLNRAYGLTGPAQGFWYVDPDSEELAASPDSYSRPAPHACFILKVEDDLVNSGGIMDLWLREARIFKFGSGAGSNFSAIRAEGEKLSGGGSSSGVMSFLKIGDRAAGAIKSGGTTRRAAKMVILDIDHPDVEEFINWKKVEEDKARILIEKGGFAADFNGEAYATISGQNSNNSVRVTDDFIRAVEAGSDWFLTERTTGEVMKTTSAEHLWSSIAEAAWACADPGVQFDTTINEWHTCPEGGRIRGSNPCSEYMFLDNTACNLASLNLVAFYDDHTGAFDIDGYLHAIRLWTIVLEISVAMAHFPSQAIAQGSYDYRTLGLGYANLGSLLMRKGVPYDSPKGRGIAGALTSILTGHGYATSAEIASAVGPFPRYQENRRAMLRVIRNHRRAAYDAPGSEYEGISQAVAGISPRHCPPDLAQAAREAWDNALEMGARHGYRNAQLSVLAPTGCLVGGSLIPTERGVVRLRSLGDPAGDQWQDLGILAGTDQGPRTATLFYVNGAEPVVTVDTGRGYRIQGTPTHRIKVVDLETGDWIWKRFGEIEAGDLVPLQMNQLVGVPRRVTLPPLGEMHWTGDSTTKVPRTVGPDLAEFVGYFMGDGSLHAKGLRLCVTGGDFEVVERLRMLGKELFNLRAHVTEKTGYSEVSFHSVPLTVWWEACGFAKIAPTQGHAGKGWHPHIPDAILSSNDPESYRAFVRGLFEADGTVNAGYPHWSTTSIQFSRDIQTLLLAIGYPTTRKMDRTGWSNSPLAVLRILNLGYSKQFAEEIGFMSDRKQAALISTGLPQAARHDHIPAPRSLIDRLVPENGRLRRTMLASLARNGMVSRRSALELLERTQDAELDRLLGYYFDRVSGAELGEDQWTYDLSVPDNVTYVANGFVSHNTIGLLMDCDTTGVEPDFALVKFKKLAGGGYFKIVNQSVGPALDALGYSTREKQDIVQYVMGTSSLDGAPHINRRSLRAHGFTDSELDRIEGSLPETFELRHAFNVLAVGEPTLRRLGAEPDQYQRLDFDLLTYLGFTEQQINKASDYICGHQTIEGAPHIIEEHLSVFDTANRNGRHGKRFIHHKGHIRMMAAAQPFISGAISKTINMPKEVDSSDIKGAYHLSWKLGLKAIALYRDGSKASQPLSSAGEDVSGENDPALEEALGIEQRLAYGPLPEGTSPTKAYAPGMNPPRFLLSSRRRGWTQEARVGGHKLFIRTGEYEDGTLGELFIDLAKEGATLRGILSCFAIAVSKGLQYGVPLEEFVETFLYQTFEPRGVVQNHPNIRMASSMVDYIFRALAIEYLGRHDLGQVKTPVLRELPEEPHPSVSDQGRQLALEAGREERNLEAVKAAARFVDSPADTISEMFPQGSATISASAQVALSQMMGDAPMCDECGHITVRNGSCYRCLNCGASLGCS